jgi:hypothetical protein
MRWATFARLAEGHGLHIASSLLGSLLHSHSRQLRTGRRPYPGRTANDPDAIENKLPPERRRRVDEFWIACGSRDQSGPVDDQAAIESYRNCGLS